MKIAILSDIHGNISALTSVLADVEKRDCEQIICLGDYVGYFYSASDVVKRLMAIENLVAIRGNHEELLFKAMESESFKKKVENKYGAGHSLAMEQLSTDELNWLRGLNSQNILTKGGVKIGVFHGSPFNISEYVYPDTKEDKFEQIEKLSLDVVLMGHTHHQFIKSNASTLFINPGSVGQARDVRGLASYAVLDLKNFSTLPIRVEYDKAELVRNISSFEESSSKLLASIGKSDE